MGGRQARRWNLYEITSAISDRVTAAAAAAVAAEEPADDTRTRTHALHLERWAESRTGCIWNGGIFMHVYSQAR